MLFSSWCVWLTHPLSQEIIRLVNIFYFIIDVKLLSAVFTPCFQECYKDVCVCVCQNFHLCWKQILPQLWIPFPVFLNLNFLKWKLSYTSVPNYPLSLHYSGVKHFNHKNGIVCFVSKSSKIQIHTIPIIH